MRFSPILTLTLFSILSSPASFAEDKDLVIMGINDLHGSLVPAELKSEEDPGVTPVSYTQGGAVALGAYVKTLRGEYGEHLLLLDAGDQWQGSLESNSLQGASMVELYNLLGVRAAAIGNHEFDFGMDALTKNIEHAKFDYLAANITASADPNVPKPPFAEAAYLKVSGVNVGVIGLSTLDTPQTTASTYAKSLTFEDLAATTLKRAKHLREEGAEVILVLAHAGIRCEATTESGALESNRVRKMQDAPGKCDPNSEIVKLLEALPEGTVDAIVSGHSHSIVHSFIHGVPVIQAGKYGKYFNLLHLHYDTVLHQVRPELTEIEGPIPVCEKVFSKQNDCEGKRLTAASGRGELVTPSIHGHEIVQDKKIQAFVKHEIARVKKIKNEVVGSVARPLLYDTAHESAMGNFFADTLRESVQADFALVTSGGIRDGVNREGNVTFGDVFKVAPFDNAISVLTLTGAEIKKLVALSMNAGGVGSVSGMIVSISGNLADPKHKIYVRKDDGELIDDEFEYTLATSDFLANGGDHWDTILKHVPKDKINLFAGPILREALVAAFKAHPGLNAPTQPLLNTAHPRVF